MLGNNAIRTITVRGFKGIRELENLELRPLNVLIGANGAGKSNFLGVFELLRAATEGRIPEFVARAGGAEQLLHFGSKVTRTISVDLELGEQGGNYQLEMIPSAGDQMASTQEFHPPAVRLAMSEMAISRLRVFHFADAGTFSLMRKTGEVDNNFYLRGDGSNLASVLYLLQERFPGTLAQIRRAVRQVAPFFDDFVLQPLALNPDTIRLQWRHRGSENEFFADALSDGTLRFIAIATLLFLPEEFRPSILVIDEPELGLHPAAITLLAALLRIAAAKTQVIVSTQSPQLLDEFEPEDVLVMDRVHGATQVRRLDSAALESWLEEFSLGQLWQKHELGGQPEPE